MNAAETSVKVQTPTPRANLPYFALLAVKPTCSFLHAFVGGGHKSPIAIDLKYTQQQP